MKISVVIPTYNQASVIIGSLETWSNQSITTDTFEVIVVDNNSTDNTENLVKEFIKSIPNIQYYKEIRPGATNARHSGARIAKGEILVFADDDGLFNENCLQAMLDVYMQYPEVSAVTGKIDLLWDSNPPSWIEPYEFMLGKLDYGSQIKTAYDLYLNGGLFSIKKSVIEELGGFNPDLIGELLVGDGDTGLVNKLHDNKKLIGYTPLAVMQHMQFVSKHGTVKDMGRRFLNTGISNTYGYFRKHNFRFSLGIMIYILKSMLFCCKKGIEYIFNAKNKAYFSYMQRRGELAFFLNLLKPEIYREVRKADNYHE